MKRFYVFLLVGFLLIVLVFGGYLFLKYKKSDLDLYILPLKKDDYSRIYEKDGKILLSISKDVVDLYPVFLGEVSVGSTRVLGGDMSENFAYFPRSHAPAWEWRSGAPR